MACYGPFLNATKIPVVLDRWVAFPICIWHDYPPIAEHTFNGWLNHQSDQSDNIYKHAHHARLYSLFGSTRYFLTNKNSNRLSKGVVNPGWSTRNLRLKRRWNSLWMSWCRFGWTERRPVDLWVSIKFILNDTDGSFHRTSRGIYTYIWIHKGVVRFVRW